MVGGNVAPLFLARIILSLSGVTRYTAQTVLEDDRRIVHRAEIVEQIHKLRRNIQENL